MTTNKFHDGFWQGCVTDVELTEFDIEIEIFCNSEHLPPKWHGVETSATPMQCVICYFNNTFVISLRLARWRHKHCTNSVHKLRKFSASHSFFHALYVICLLHFFNGNTKKAINYIVKYIYCILIHIYIGCS